MIFPMVFSTKNAVLVLLFLVASNVCAANAAAEDWLRFRGENGSGLIAEKRNLPMKWDRESKENIKWAIDLPGPGHSSPIIVGDRVLLTCWTGYGTGVEGEDDQAKLARHLLCYHRETGKELWRRSVAAVLPEDRYEGMFAEHGYATHTPVSDGKHVFVFFGKSGVHAFELESGEPLWQQFVGNGLDPRRWGSAGSPILHKTKGDDSKQLVIVPAIAESTMLVALDAENGDVVWEQRAEGLASTWGTPILVPVDETRTDLVMGVPYEIWGMNPDNGKLRWYADGIDADSISASVVHHQGVIYLQGGRSGGTVAVRSGGKGQLKGKDVLWQENHRGRIASPVVSGKRLYWMNGGVISCLDTSTGDRIQQVRLRAPEGATDSGSSRDGGGSSRGGSRFGGGRRGGGFGADYGSPILVGEKIYVFNRKGLGYVVAANDELEQIGGGVLSDGGEFS
ncbi:MAG: PQQ-binding-like beta-propeller repeat protein, partial [Planctomycetota bacterium]